MGKRNSSPQKVPLLVASPTPESNPNALIQKGTYFVNATGWSVDPETDEVYLNVIRNGQEVSVPFSELAIKKPVPYATKYAHYYSEFHDPDVTRLLKAGQIVSIDLVKEVSRVKNVAGSDTIDVKPKYVGLTARKEPDVGAHATSTKKIYLNLNNNNFPKSVHVLKSIFRHEVLHLTEEVEEGKNEETGKWERKYTFWEHAKVYLEQMKYPEFLECPENFQRSIIKGFCKRLLAHVFKKEDNNSDRFNKYINEFNQYFGSGRTNSKGEVITVNVQGIGGGETQFFGISHIIVTYNRKKKGERSSFTDRYSVNYEIIEDPSQ